MKPADGLYIKDEIKRRSGEFQDAIDRFREILDSEFQPRFLNVPIPEKAVEEICQILDDLPLRVNAVVYHSSRVVSLAREQQRALERLQRMDFPKCNGLQGLASQRASYRVENWNVLHEFLAYLVALRTAVDFIARLVALHVPGIRQTRRITRLRHSLRKMGMRHRILEILDKHWEDWIEYIRKYRDDLLHLYSVRICATLGWEAVSIVRKGKRERKVMSHTANYAVPVHPEREQSILAEDNLFVEERFESCALIDGQVYEKDIAVNRKLDASRFIDIVTFCDTYFERLLDFSTQVLQELARHEPDALA